MAPENDSRHLAAYLHDLGMMLTLRAELRAELQPLSATEQEVMRMVQQRPGIRRADVADELGVARTNLSAAIRKLIGLGLVLKTPDVRDRRSGHLHLSLAALFNVDCRTPPGAAASFLMPDGSLSCGLTTN